MFAQLTLAWESGFFFFFLIVCLLQTFLRIETKIKKQNKT